MTDKQDIERIDKQDIERVKQATSLLDVIGNDTKWCQQTKHYGGTHKGPCPFCRGRDRFHVHPAAGNWWCRQCERKGDVYAYWMQRYNVPFSEAYKVLALAVGMEVSEKAAPDRWIEPIITAGFAQMPADGWIGGVTLYRNDGQPVTFYSGEEMRAATMAG